MRFLAAATTALVLTPVQSFAPSSFIASPHQSNTKNAIVSTFKSSQSSSASNTALSSVGISGECLLTPEGYGFSATAERILTNAKRGNNGFYKASGSDKVIDVMGGITNGSEDVALIYEKGELLGIFTETDYINVSYNHIYLMNHLCILKPKFPLQ